MDVPAFSPEEPVGLASWLFPEFPVAQRLAASAKPARAENEEPTRPPGSSRSWGRKISRIRFRFRASYWLLD